MYDHSGIAGLAGVFDIVKLIRIQRLKTRMIGIRNRKIKWPTTLDEEHL